MTQITNFFFVDAKNRRMINPNTFEGKYCLSGKVTGREGFKDGALIKTSNIVSVKDNIATTASGSKYELGEMSPDYIDFLEAVKKDIPVITWWDFPYYHRSEAKNIDATTAFVGKTSISFLPMVSGKITAQEGNFLTINGIKFFVLWNTWDAFDCRSLNNQFHNLKYPEDFEEFAGCLCKPKFFRD